MADYVPSDDGPLSAPEATRLTELLATIKRGASMAAQALAAIHTEKLYRAYGTWDDFCRIALGYTRQRGYQLLGQAVVSTVVGAPVSERVARELVQRPPEVQRAAVQLAGEQATADQVRDVANLLENMTPAEQVAALNAQEARALARAAAPMKSRQDYVEAIRRHLATVQKLFAHLPDVLAQASKRIAGLIKLAEEGDLNPK